jgi:CheY-like chemotaxis protein
MKPMKKLILVDDDEIVIFMTKRIIKEVEDIELTATFKNGLDAINYFKENAQNPDLLPDILFLDLFMPIMDGWQFLEEFLSVKPNLAKPILIYVVSSSIYPEDISKAKSYSDVFDYIIKPITKKIFTDLIETLK